MTTAQRRDSGLEDILPLSPLQEGLLFESQLEEHGPDVYTVQTVLDLEGSLDGDLLRRAASALLNRHANLKAAFRYRANGSPVALVPRRIELPWRVVDVSGLDGAARDAECERIAAEESARRFDLGKPPLVRFVHIGVGDGRHRLVITNHHILLDGWSMPLLVRELFALYGADADPAALPRVTPYKNYLGWLAGQDRDAAESAWREALDGLAAPTLVSPGADALSTEPGVVRIELPGELSDGLATYARAHGLTLNNVVSGAWALSLSALTGQDDVVFGTTVSGRPPELPGVESMIGLFINTVPVRVRLRAAEPVGELLARIQREQSELLEHQHLGLSAIQRITGQGELFDTLAVFENYPFDPDGVAEPAPGLRLAGVGGGDATHYPLTLTVLPGQTLRIELGYRPDVVDEQWVSTIGDRLLRLFRTVIDAPATPVGRLDLLGPEESHRLLVEWNDTAREFPATLLPGTLAEHARLTPQATALVHRGERLSFAELDQRVNRLARLLVRRGARPEQVVPLVLPRGVDLIVALLAVLESGAAYVPVDPDLPVQRIGQMLGGLGAELVIAVGSVADRAGAAGANVLLLDDPEVHAEIAGQSDAPVTDPDRRAALRPGNTAYVLFTSGSTGVPKGVVIEHGSLANLFHNHAATLTGPEAEAKGSPLRVALTAALSFDTSWEGLLALLDGHELHLVDDDTRRDPEALVDYVANEGIDLLDLTPTFAQQAVAAGLLRDPRHRPGVLMLGGEATGASLWTDVRDASETVGYNYYGPTECTVDTLSCSLDESASPIVGRPLANTSAYVLDSRLRPVPAGVAGELYLAGAPLARGYTGRPDLTADRFVANPYGEPGSRMYRTGDVVRWRADGRLEYVGRSDSQVKIRGYRIELSEVELALEADPSVGQAVALARTDGGVTWLVAYVVAGSGQLDTVALSERLAAVLPEYMVPAAIVSLDAFPMTRNGKVDRVALPKPEFAPSGAGARPGTRVERVLCEAFAAVLGLPEVGLDDNFFTLGGDSILSIQVVSRARAEGVLLRPRDVFQRRTVRALAELARDADDAGTAAEEDPREAIGTVPLTPIMRALLDTSGPIERVHQSMVLRVPAAMTLPALTSAVARLLDRHGLLRARLRDGDAPVLEVPEPGTVPASSVVSRVPTERDQLSAATANALDTSVAALSPADGRMLRVVWVDAGPGQEGRLVLVAHHLVVDGVSWRILLSDLAEDWAAADSGRPVPERPRTTSFRTWARALSARAEAQDVLGELNHWRDTLGAGDAALGTRPLDPRRDTQRTARTVTVELPGDLAEPLLGDTPEALRASVNEVLLAALTAAVGGWRARTGAANRALLVDLEGHGRAEEFVGDQVDLSRTVGWFTVSYPVRLDSGDASLDESFRESDLGSVLRRVKDALRAVPGDGLGYGLLRHINPRTTSELAALGGAQVEFNYLGRFGAKGESGPFAPSDEGALLGGGDAGADLPLTHALQINAAATETDDGLKLTAHWTWAGELLDESDVRAIAVGWSEALTALVEQARHPGSRLTPADLPLVSLSQDEVSELERAHPGLIDVLPVTRLGEGLLFHALAAGEDDDQVDIYTVQDIIELSGPLDVAMVRASAEALLRRHPNLRAAFHRFEQLVQVIPGEVDLPWREIDLADLSADERAVEAERLAREERNHRFDPACAPLLRFLVLRVGPDTHQIVFTCHHVLLDGWSTQLMARDLFAIYRAGGDESALPKAPSYADYLRWMGEQDRDAAVDAWRQALSGLERPTRVSDRTVRSGSEERTRVSVELPAEPTERVAEAARRAGVTQNTVLQSAWGLLLAQLTGRDDVVFGQTVSGRPPEVDGAEDIVGLLINTVPVRVSVRAEETVSTLLGRLADEQAALMPHQHLGLTDIQRAAGLGPLFDTLVVFENFPVEEGTKAEPAPGLRVTSADGIDATHYPLTLAVLPGGRLGLHLEYHPECFTEERARTVLDRFVRLLSGITDDPATGVARLESLTPEERDRVLVRWNDNALDVQANTLPGLFSEQVARTPDAVAVARGRERLTFAELDARANRLAHALVERGAGPERIVALLLPRSIDAVVSILAVMKAGAAYLPIDPAYPPARMGTMLADARPELVVTTSELAPMLDGTEVRWLPLDGLALDDQPADNPRTELTPRHPAYVIYTSGSTGTPKGVVVTHASVVNLFHSHRQTLYRPTVDAAGGRALRVGHTWSFAFDASWQPQLWMLDGHALHIVDEETLRDPSALDAQVRAERLDFIEVSPSLAVALAAAGLIDDGECPLLALGVGGEAVPDAFWRELRELTGTACYNLYGPTETTVDALAARVRDSERPLVGRPTVNTSAYVLDSRLRPVAPGVTGELYLGGAGLARGYLGRYALTAERFVADPFGPPGARMYRTGDLARWTEDGSIDYLGRADEQVKVRGFRVELGEIASAISAHESVAQCVVEFRNGRIVAYLIPAAGDGTEFVRVVREFLADRLPGYMVPAAFVVLAELPLTAHGKVDRAALPDPDPAALGSGRPPRDLREAVLCELFCEVLGVPGVGVDDNFFDLGGHSLLLVDLRRRIEQEYGQALPVARLFAHATPALLAEQLDGGESAEPVGALVPLRTTGSRAPLFCMHPAGGLSWGYLGLRRHIDTERPLYGLQATAALHGEELPGVDAMAREYAEAIRQTQPNGPYHLAGWSLGGVIAHAVARLLVAAGERVELLALLDADPAAAAYGPGEPFDGDVVFFTAQDSSGSYRWRQLITGEIENYEIDCPHDDMLTPGPLAEIGAVLDEKLGKLA